jgi:hypothetical protein
MYRAGGSVRVGDRVGHLDVDVATQLADGAADVFAGGEMLLVDDAREDVLALELLRHRAQPFLVVERRRLADDRR